jgi:uncharacterized protein YlxP (DUF503 family)
MIGIITFHLYLPVCTSLKEKRGRLKPLLVRLHRQFNVSAAEMALQDQWQEAVIACGMVGNEAVYLRSALETVSKWVEANWPDGDVLDTKLEIIYP